MNRCEKVASVVLIEDGERVGLLSDPLTATVAMNVAKRTRLYLFGLVDSALHSMRGGSSSRLFEVHNKSQLMLLELRLYSRPDTSRFQRRLHDWLHCA